MADINTVLKAWECCNPLNRRCSECPYKAVCFHDSFDRVAIADMVRLLKEQQPKKAKWKAVHYIRKEGTKTFKKCTCCGYTCNGWDIETGIAYDYCPNCGAEMQNGNTNRDSK